MSENRLLDLSLEFAAVIVDIVDHVNIPKSSYMTEQLGRAGTSIGANIHEAQYAQSRKDFISKLEIALKESNETSYWPKLLLKTNRIDEQTHYHAEKLCGNIRRLLIASVRTAKENQKMSLSEIEEAFTSGKCTPELLEQFKSALRHSPKSLRAQHCYTTAVAMPTACFQQAVELIEYALELSESWSDEMRAYHNLAIIHEKIGDYGKAINCYKFALAVIDPDRVNDYSADYAFRMLVCLLHEDNFRYTTFLRRLYEQSLELDEFSRSFQKSLFYLSLAEIVIHRHNGNIPAARAAYAKANSILHPGYAGPLSVLLKRKNYIESAGATPEALAFLKRIKNQLR